MNKTILHAFSLLAIACGILLPDEMLFCQTRVPRRRGIISESIKPQSTHHASDFEDVLETPPAKPVALAHNDAPTVFDRDEFVLPKELQSRETHGDADLRETLRAIPQRGNEPEELVEFQFENTDLTTLVKQVEELFSTKFISDETIEPMRQGGKALKGNKITFRTNKPLSRLEAFNLFLTFLDIAGLSIVALDEASQLTTQNPLPKAGSMFRIQTVETARKAPIRAEIGTLPDLLPNSDEVIRYVYFVENSTLEALVGVVEALRSSASALIQLNEHKGFILTDRAYNVKTLMAIVKELDKVSTPETMSVLKLRRADAEDVKKLYQALIQGDDRSNRFFGQKKPVPTQLLPEDTKIIAEPRTNSLILLGTRNAIKKIEDFVKKHIDVDLDKPRSPLYVYPLKYADAETIAEIMNDVSKFGQDTPAGKAGGVRGDDKYLKKMSFTAEKSTNSLIIRGDYTSYLMAKEAIEKLDEEQPRLAVEVLILQVTATNKKELGTQLRSKQTTTDSLTGNVRFQTSGLYNTSTVQTNSNANQGVKRLLGDLVNLATGAPIGSTLITLGQDLYGVWGIFQALQTVSNVQIISNPFIVAANKAKASVAVGETRRIETGEAQSLSTNESTSLKSYTPLDAKLTVEVTPQINADNMIVLDLMIDITDFKTDGARDATTLTKKIVTRSVVANQEVIALGGLIKNKSNSSLRKFPFLGELPVVGWFFKNKLRDQEGENLLILLSTSIMKPSEVHDIGAFTSERVADYHGALDVMQESNEKRDPINRVFFEKQAKSEKMLDDFIFDRGKKRSVRHKERRLRNKQKRKETPGIPQLDQDSEQMQRDLLAENKPQPHEEQENKAVKSRAQPRLSVAQTLSRDKRGRAA